MQMAVKFAEAAEKTARAWIWIELLEQQQLMNYCITKLSAT
jgi:hypothetical protein